MKIRIHKSDITLFLCIGILFYSLFPIYIWGTAVAANSRIIATIIGFVFVILKISKIHWKKFLPHICFSIIIFISSYINNSAKSINDILEMLVPCFLFLNIFLIFDILVSSNKEKLLIDWLKFFFLIWFVFVTISVYQQLGINAGIYNPYFIGNKFNTSYFYVLLTCIFDLQNSRNPSIKNRIVFIIMWIFSLISSALMNCTTAVFMLIIVCILHLCVKNKSFIFKHIKLIIVILILFITLIILKFDKIISSQIISKFLMNIGETNTMNARSLIYRHLPKIIRKKLLLGYGYNSDIVAKTFSGNAQNALLNIVIQFGVIGAVGFIYMVISSIKNFIQKNVTLLAPVIYYIIAFIIAGIVEITFGYYFYLLLALLMVKSRTKKEVL